MAGVAGATVATFGMVVPSFVVIFVISKFLDDFLKFTVIAHAFQGIKIAVGLIIFEAAVRMIKKMSKKVFSKVVVVCSFVTMMAVNVFSLKFSSITLMIMVGILSFLIYKTQEKIKNRGGADE